jgi:hypothetical protein
MLEIQSVMNSSETDCKTRDVRDHVFLVPIPVSSGQLLFSMVSVPVPIGREIIRFNSKNISKFPFFLLISSTSTSFLGHFIRVLL